MMAGLRERESKNQCFSVIAPILDSSQNRVCVCTLMQLGVCVHKLHVFMEATGNFRGPPLGAVHLGYFNSVSN